MENIEIQSISSNVEPTDSDGLLETWLDLLEDKEIEEL
jgi:hypothetical protein